MTPNARYAAAIDCLTGILEGDPAEKTLTNWARSNRYAGSKDQVSGIRSRLFRPDDSIPLPIAGTADSRENGVFFKVQSDDLSRCKLPGSAFEFRVRNWIAAVRM